MTAPAAPPAPVPARRFFRPVVRLSELGDPLGDPLTQEHESTDYACTAVAITSGGQVDSATLSRRLGWTAETIEDADAEPAVAGDREQILDGLGRRCEIWIEDPEDEDAPAVPVFVGVLRQRDVLLSSGEVESVTATLEPDDFGGSVRGMRMWNPLLGEPEEEGDDPPGGLALVERDWIFNPIRKRTETVEGNMSSQRPTVEDETFPGLDDDEHPRLWLDPESTRTTVGDTLHADAGPNIKWTLSDAARTIQHELLVAFREDERDPGDPDADPAIDPGPLPNKPLVEASLTEEDLKPLTSSDESLFRNVRVPIGTRLPDALDAIIRPLGCGWRVDAEHLGEGANGDECRAVIRFYAVKNAPTKRKLRLGKAGSQIDDPVGTVTKFQAGVNLAGTTQRVRVVGTPKVREVTVELFRDWDADDDDETAESLKADEDGGLPDGKESVWRRFVANEAHDRTNTRPEITNGPDLTTALGSFLPRRVPLMEPLTLRDPESKTRIDYRLEWKVTEGGDWEEVPEGWGWKPLDDEIGVQFTGRTPPPNLIADNTIIEADEEADPPVEAAAYPRLRITGTLHSDERTAYSHGDPVDDEDELVAADTYLANTVMEDRFSDRERVDSDDDATDDDLDNARNAFSRLTKDGVADRDDSTEGEQAARELSERLRLGRSTHSVELAGIVTHLRVGDHVDEIRSRGISLAVFGISSTPYITSIKYDFAKQSTALEFAS